METGFFEDSHNSKEHTRMSGEKPSSITPLTIRQLLGRKTVSEKFIVDGKELYIVEVLGMVTSINSRNGFTTIQIDDCTGKLDVKVFDESVNNNPFLKSEVEQIQYVLLYIHKC
ncbi:predicted protein [Naegleria gruberi]|uniref:Predicted protein n=1 Tax=Naegleria gruberi TaxID=5762 RepID=D2VJJ5_NAEGR|nr:uncharacterized protein NAEGRDRAFT_69061 [Naegleria gruberi]EFC43049.1 predicted protein [Naegleria gruberi]|eukprot:XP_002675793.1 predicted protein [Naegleria gruberi strain NEG-M]